MAFLGGGVGSAIGGLLFGPVGSLLGIGGKAKKLRTPKPVTRDTVREQVERDDALRRRRGTAADMITGTRGAEASAASVGRLVVGN